MKKYTNEQAMQMLNNIIKQSPSSDGSIIQGGYKKISKFTYDEYSMSDIGEITLWEYRVGSSGSGKKYKYKDSKSIGFFALLISLKNQIKDGSDDLDELLSEPFNPMTDCPCGDCGKYGEECNCE